ncbi:hypothetical protein Trydic_g18637 [Trypoxylus dichotomus]
MDGMIGSIRGKGGYFMGRHDVSLLCYAGDAVLLTTNEDHLQRLTSITSKKYNRNISTDKTKSIAIRKRPVRCKLEVDGFVIQQVIGSW